MTLQTLFTLSIPNYPLILYAENMPVQFQPSVISHLPDGKVGQSSAPKAESRQPKTKSYKKGFTLIELMIGVSIIAVIAAVGLVSFSQAQKLGRDAKRKQDLRTIAVALELYKQKNGRYPYTGTDGSGNPIAGCQAASDWCTSANGLDPWIPGIDNTFINPVPKDPLADSGNPWAGGPSFTGYAYHANNCLGSPFYVLVAGLENTSDPQRNALNPYIWCGGVNTVTVWGWNSSFVLSNR